MFHNLDPRLIDLLYWTLSILATWGVTVMKRKGKELPAPVEAWIGDDGITYEELKEAFDYGQKLATDPAERRNLATRKLQEIAGNKLGKVMPTSVTNYLTEHAVQLANEGWKVIRDKALRK